MEISHPYKFIDEWCVEEGQTIELKSQVTFQYFMGATIKYALLKDGQPVAIARQADDQQPSSLSILYRETVDADAKFSIGIHADSGDGDGDDHIWAHIAPGNVQVGMQIYDTGY